MKRATYILIGLAIAATRQLAPAILLQASRNLAENDEQGEGFDY